MPPKSPFLLSLNMPKNEAARGQKRKHNRDGMIWWDNWVQREGVHENSCNYPQKILLSISHYFFWVFITEKKYTNEHIKNNNTMKCSQQLSYARVSWYSILSVLNFIFQKFLSAQFGFQPPSYSPKQ